MNLILCLFTSFVLAVKGLVIPVQFEDLKFNCGKENLERIAEESASYFNEENIDIGKIEFFVTNIYTDSKSHLVYGANNPSTKDALFYSVVQNACRELDKTVDFSKFDYLIFAVPGKSEADSGEDNLFWPQTSKLEDANAAIILDGKKLNDYAVVCELGPDGFTAGIGDFCHEVGHLLGLKDFYDTDNEKSGGISEGLGGELILMDKGNKAGLGRTPPPLSVAEFDILSPKRISEIGKGSFSLEGRKNYFKVNTGCPGRYYLIEYLNGLRVSLINKSTSNAGYSDYQRRNLSAFERWELNEINCSPEFLCARCIANGVKDRNNCIKMDSLAIIDIRTTSEEKISFDIIEPIAMKNTICLQREILLEWEPGINPEIIANARVEWKKDGTKYFSRGLNPSEYSSFVLSNLSPGTEWTITIYLSTIDGEEFKITKVLKTRVLNEEMAAFIYFPASIRNSDGTFIKGSRTPLSLYNISDDIREIDWTFDGKKVGEMVILDSDGVLQAKCIHQDGRTEIIRKTILVR